MRKEHRLTRREKAQQAIFTRQKRVVESVEETSYQPIPRLEPKNSNQKLAIRFCEEGKPIVFLTGSAGTGKSLIAAHRAATLLRTKRISKVYLVRPAVSVGKSIGMLPGEIEEKLAPYFAQTIAHLGKFLGPAAVQYDLKAKKIEMKPVEYLRGMSFENCLVICEEVQNFTDEEMEMMLTRLGENASIIFTGDTKQHDLKGASGLDTTLRLLDKVLQTHPEYMNADDMDVLDDGIGIVRFKPEDVVRSGLTRAFVKMYYHKKD